LRWQNAAEALLLVIDHNGPTMFALNSGKPVPDRMLARRNIAWCDRLG
jgi:hypothetical protein